MHDGYFSYVNDVDEMCDRFDISQTGIGILEAYGSDILIVDDAVEKFLETLEWVDSKIEEIYNGFQVVGELCMEHSTEMDYSGSFDSLRQDLNYYSELREIIQNDLNSITGNDDRGW